MQPPVHQRHVLTGAVRGRRARFSRKLILQVEVEVQRAPAMSVLLCPPPPPGCLDLKGWREQERQRAEESWKTERIVWRDATEADQNELLPRCAFRAFEASP